MKINTLKGLLLTCLIVVSACKEDNEAEISPSLVTIEFSSVEISEGSMDPLKIHIRLDNPLPVDASLEFIFQSDLEYDTYYYTVPETNEKMISRVEITAGTTEADIEIYSRDNEERQGDKEILISLGEIDSNLKLSEEFSEAFTITLIDDEVAAPLTVGFEQTEVTLPENSWPQFASTKMVFSEELPNPVTIVLKENTTLRWGYDYDSFYGPSSVTPTCTDGYNCEVTIVVAAGSKEVSGVESFVFDNNVADGDRAVVFEIVSIDQGVGIQQDKKTFTFNIKDDD